jgi:hypothetical protein
MKSFAFAVLCSILLAACVTAPEQPPVMATQTVEVKQAVPVPCVDTIPPAPAFLSDRALLTGSGAVVADQLWSDHLERRDYIDQLVAVLLKCKTPQGAASGVSSTPLAGASFK